MLSAGSGSQSQRSAHPQVAGKGVDDRLTDGGRCGEAGAADDVQELRDAPDAAVALRPRGAAHAVQRLRRALQEGPATDQLLGRQVRRHAAVRCRLHNAAAPAQRLAQHCLRRISMAPLRGQGAPSTVEVAQRQITTLSYPLRRMCMRSFHSRVMD